MNSWGNEVSYAKLISAATEALLADNISTYVDVEQDICDGLLSEVVTVVVDAVLKAQRAD